MKQPSSNKTLMVLFGICAVVWIVRFLTGLFSGGESLLSDLICAIIWTAGFAICFSRYRREKQTEDDTDHKKES